LVFAILIIVRYRDDRIAHGIETILGFSLWKADPIANLTVLLIEVVSDVTKARGQWVVRGSEGDQLNTKTTPELARVVRSDPCIIARAFGRMRIETAILIERA